MRDERGDLHLGAALLLVLSLFLVGLGALPLVEPDEGRYADVARSLLRDASWYLPLANGTPFLDKPPLVAWCTALAIEALGPAELVVRLVPVAFSLLAALVAAAFARAVYGDASARALAPVVYASGPLALVVGRTLTLDAPLTGLVALGSFLHLRAVGALGSAPARRHAWSVAGGIALGLGTLVKGPVALVLGGLFVLGALVAHRRDPLVRWRLLSPLPFVVGVLVASPWYALVLRAEPEFARIFFWHENLARFAGIPGEHRHGPFFFLAVTAGGLGAWLLPAGVVATRPARLEPEAARARATLLWGAALVVLFFSASRTKVETYVLPAFPALAALVAGEVARALEDHTTRAWSLLRVAFACAATLVAVGAVLAFLFALGVVPAARPELELVRDAVRAPLALLPLPPVVLAVALARRGRALAAAFALASALVAAEPFGMDAARVLATARSPRPIARLVTDELARGGERPVATYHYYYRGLPYYLDRPIVLLGENNELKNEAFAQRPDLFYPDFCLPPGVVPGYLAYFEDCWTRGFLANGRALVVVPEGQRRPQRFLDACARAKVRARFVARTEEDLLFEVGP